MPFVNPEQRKACYAQANAAKKAGEKPKWDCKEYGSKILHSGRKRKIYKGPRGGKYVLVNGQKKYIKAS